MSGNPRHKLPIHSNRAAIADEFDALFGNEFAGRGSTPQDIPIDLIDPSPLQARQVFDNLEELAQSMREHGFTSRIRVRPHPTLPQRYQLVYGERRLRAARIAGITMIPADVAEHTEAELREIGLTENIIREDLNPVDEAQAFEQALAARDDNGQPLYTVRRLAERIGKSAGYVDRRLALLRTPADVQQLVRERPDTVQIARELAKLDQPEERAPLIEGLLNRTLSSRDVESVVDEAQRLRADQAPAPDIADEEQTPVATRPARPPRSPGQMHATDPVKGTSAGRASTRARLQIEQRVNALIPSVREALPSLQRSDRDALIDLIVAQVIPALGDLVTELQQDGARNGNAEG
ncbi:MAG: ParB/RepB/Spo0J family partition protein [Chloroflexota bacterium]|nr:ParB/RepB/Spo0J family partition protein [Chloroflexota bacterium]PLS77856.1 MAG: hypothetical protein CYG59_21595 [Chloroflexota bacterium]